MQCVTSVVSGCNVSETNCEGKGRVVMEGKYMDIEDFKEICNYIEKHHSFRKVQGKMVLLGLAVNSVQQTHNQC